MKTYNILLHSLCAAAAALLLAALTACTADPIEFDAGSDAAFDPVGLARPGFYSPLADADTLVQVWVKPGDLFQDQITFGLPKEAPEDVTVTIRVADDEEWLTNYNSKLHLDNLSIQNVDAGETKILRTFGYIPAQKISVPSGEMIISKGSYGINLPISVDMSELEENRCNFFVMLEATVSQLDGNTIHNRIRYHFHFDVLNTIYALERQKGHGDSNLEYIVGYFDPSWLDPRICKEYRLYKETTDWNTYEATKEYFNFFDAIALLGCTVGYDEERELPTLKYDRNLYHVLRFGQKYLCPLNDVNIRTTIVISGSGSGIGFCNVDERQRASLIGQITNAVTNYNLDGVTLMDESTGYGKEGMPAIDPSSYALFIRDLRAALGSDKLILLVDSGKPAATLYEAHDGVAAGQFIDYAWTGTSWDFTDPYADPSRGTIAGLDKDRYGRFAFRYRDSGISTEEYNSLKEELYIIAETNDPKILAFELSPVITGAESSTGPSRISDMTNAVCPFYDDGSIFYQWNIEYGWSISGFGSVIQDNSYPPYANQLYFPDWLRY